MRISKRLVALVASVGVIGVLIGCGVNPATGERQFAGLMSPGQENQVGASEHQKVLQDMGLYNDPALAAYVSEIGARVAKNTERPDVQFKFFVVDSPIVNAFALPGGYVYISRGLLALANSEAEVAAVLAHETAHITARHSAERYSHGVAASLAAAVISAAVDSSGVSQALGLGSNLYISSYSRKQEREADSLGLRYMTRGGYAPSAMPAFLESLRASSEIEAQEEGRRESGTSYFSTHPATVERVAETGAEAKSYPQNGDINRARHLAAIEGMNFGDSPDQGLVRGQTFIHPTMGFTFSVPQGFRLINQSDKVIAQSQTGAVIMFDMTRNPGANSPKDYVANYWLKQQQTAANVESISVNGMDGATAGLQGSASGRPMNIRLIAIAWNNGFARFQIAIPQNAGSELVEDLKRSSYSFRAINESDRAAVRPWRVRVVTAGAGDTVSSLAARQPFGAFNEARFRVLNALSSGQSLKPGEKYKIITD
jgi:predicted Zn-dependent protease